MASPRCLAERLGYAADTRLLIVVSENLGFTRSTNVAAYEAMRRGRATTAGLMVPAPWARDAASDYRGEDVGVELTLNAEWDTYRWGPLTHAPSLLDGDGGFPRTRDDTWDHADLDETRRECRAQIERAIFWGFDVSHLGAHLGTLQLRADFYDVYLELALDFDLPLRLPPASAEKLTGFPFRTIAVSEGIVVADHVITSHGPARRTIERLLVDLPAGVSEVRVRPGVDTEELRAACTDWADRVDDHAFVSQDPALRDLLERSGAVLLGYRALRDLQRADR